MREGIREYNDNRLPGACFTAEASETYVWCVSYLIYQLRKRTYLAVHNLFRQLNLGSTNSQLKKPIVNFEMPPELAFWSHMIVKVRLMYTLYKKKKIL